MKILRNIVLLFSALLWLYSASGHAASYQDSWSVKPNWKTWVKQLKEEAMDRGISSRTFDRALKGVKPSKRVLSLDRNQPERRISYLKYQKTRVSAYRIKLGKQKLKQYSGLLNEISSLYGVNPCYITAFWGLESSYGNYLGKFPVIQSLATLAYDSRRGEFFREQLLYALQIVNDGHVPLHKFKGEWAGASGHPQFLPSSWYNYAIDHNGDGRKDIWNTYGDVFASIANYLRENGWQPHQPTLYEVKLSKKIPKALLTLKTTKTVKQWEKLGY